MFNIRTIEDDVECDLVMICVKNIGHDTGMSTTGSHSDRNGTAFCEQGWAFLLDMRGRETPCTFTDRCACDGFANLYMCFRTRKE